QVVQTREYSCFCKVCTTGETTAECAVNGWSGDISLKLTNQENTRPVKKAKTKRDRNARTQSREPRDDAQQGVKEKPRSVLRENDENKCVKCDFEYNDMRDPKKREQWIMCTSCKRWAHESCARYGNIDQMHFTCHKCVNKEK
ncbi:unnamed protein product, partial [Owenia fusiformis]